MPVYNWLRVVLSVLSLLSFIPQIHRIIIKNTSVDISLTYILLNTISTTEQFALGFYYIASHNHDSDFFVSDPRNLGDWLNLVQLTIVWVMSLILFATCLTYEPNFIPKTRVIALYTSFLVISVLPLLIDFFSPIQNSEDERWSSAIFIGVHTMFINPLVTLGGIAALYFQWPKAGAAALSDAGLAAQAAVFAAVAVSWIGRVRFIEIDGRVGWFPVESWYQLVGWATVDNAVFAVVQGVLFFLRRQLQSRKIGAEEEPLLAH
ncbi:hypothetical protein BKA65DRAFT_510134 [Rhexocercosporidium sp. MPI-PUGE-AT-0058]|nr:hypothetical protein BKA65DRAFT_510134 [Rhexocercosporidium sp. MPI-PUGE-AT-0058]